MVAGKTLGGSASLILSVFISQESTVSSAVGRRACHELWFREPGLFDVFRAIPLAVC